MNIKELLSSKFLFQIDRVMLHREDKVFLVAGAILVVLAVIFKLAAIYAPTPIDAKYRQKFYNLFLTIGLSEVVWFGARYYFIGFFGSHFVALLILLIGLAWLVFIVSKMVKNYRTEKVFWEKEQIKLKYLPK
jgi:hypothetical protein